MGFENLDNNLCSNIFYVKRFLLLVSYLIKNKTILSSNFQFCI